MDNKGQIPIREVGGIILLGVIIIYVLSSFTALSTGNVSSSIDSLINAFIPLFIFIIFFDIIRRIFR